MFTHRVIIDDQKLGRVTVFIQIQDREAPTSGSGQGICPGRGIVAFDWSNIIESACTGLVVG